MPFTPDRGWSWVVMAASFCTFFINGINSYCVGMMYIALLSKYPGRVTMASTVVAVCGSMYALAAPFSVVVINLTNCGCCHFIGGLLLVVGLVSSFFVNSIDVLLVTYGLIAGAGIGFCLTSSVIMVCFYFEKLRSLASGVAFGGAGVGMFVAGIFIQYALDEFGLHGAFLILAGLNAHMCVIAMLMRPLPGYELHCTCSGVRIDTFAVCGKYIKESCSVFKKIIKNRAYLFFTLTVASWSFSLNAVLVHEPNYAVQLGVATIDQSALLVTAFGVGNTVSRYLVGLSTSEKGLDAMIVYIGQVAISGVTTLCFPLYAHTYIGHLVFCSILGFYTGGLNSQLSPLTYSILGMDYFSPGLGILMLFSGAAWLCGPPVIGIILENGGTYEQGFIVIGCFFLLGAFCNVVSGTLQNRYIPEEYTEKDGERSAETALIRSHTIDLNGAPHRTLKGMGELAAIGMSLTSLTSRGSPFIGRMRTLSGGENVQDASTDYL